MLLVEQNILTIATHFQRPDNLDQEFRTRVANAHPELIENQDGTFTRTFKIVSGQNSWWFTNQDKRKRYIDWLVTL